MSDQGKRSAEPMETRLEQLERALAFYADERNYDPRGAPGVHLWEVHEDDPSRWWPEPVGWRDDRGAVARRALAGEDFYVPWEPGKPPAIARAHRHWRWRCETCGASARMRRDLVHAKVCADTPDRRQERPFHD